MQEPVQPLTPDTLIHERYYLRSLLGQGGMSRVYLATDLRLSIRVAVKENLQPEPQARDQFHHEAEFLAALSHPNLPRVTDYFDDEATGRQYLIMDYIEGEDLGAMVQRQGPLREEQAVALILQILDALEYLHNQQIPIIHRDIKPSNIKITPQGKAMLVDFGIAKAQQASGLTLTGARAVTPGFAPPEQYGMRTDARSDVYAVGATLYTLLTGQIPPESTLRVANLVTMPALRTLLPGISPRVENAVRMAMEPDTTRRWATAKEFRAALAPPSSSRASRAQTATARSVVSPVPDLQPATAPEIAPKSGRPTVRATDATRRSSWPAIALTGLVALLALTGGFYVFGNNLGIAVSRSPNQVSQQPLVAGGNPSSTPVPSTPVPTSDLNATQTALSRGSQVTQPAQAEGLAANQTAAALSAQPTSTPTPPGSPMATAAAATARPTSTPKPPDSPSPLPVTPASLKATATFVPQPSETVMPQGSASVAVVSVRLEPANPQRNQQLRFFVTFRNTFTSTQSRAWSIWVYRQGNLRRSFWHSRSQTSSVATGDVELATAPDDTLCVCGPGGAESFVAQVLDDGTASPAPGLDGQPFAGPFTVNP